MNPDPSPSPRDTWSRILVLVGSIAMLAGAIDPMEGSLVVLPGSGLVALGTFLGRGDRRLLTFRLWVFVLIGIGVGAMWGLTQAGGLGGNSGRSAWWGLLVLPYLFGWSASTWGPGAPRWFTALALGIGAWYLVILVMALRSPAHPRGDMGLLPVIVVGCVGAVTLCGCAVRLMNRRPPGK